MKTDLATSIIAAIAGVLIAYFVTNLFMGPIEDVSYNIHPTVTGDVISGRVLTESGLPVPGVTVKMVKSGSKVEEETVTNDKGMFSFRFTGMGTFNLSASDSTYGSALRKVVVDAASEEDIWNCIHTLSNTKTLLIISHRLSTVRNADTIYVMREGKVAESGGHDKLIALDGIYARLVREQDILENYGRRAV